MEYTSGESKLYDVINLAIIPQKPKTVKPSDKNWSQTTKTNAKWQKLKPSDEKFVPREKNLKPSDNNWNQMTKTKAKCMTKTEAK